MSDKPCLWQRPLTRARSARREPGRPAPPKLTPAYLSFNAAFNQQDWGEGAAIAFILFAIIVFFTVVQRWVLRDKDEVSSRGRRARAVAVEAKR